MTFPTPEAGSTIRWIVRREATRAPRFGETRRDVVQWAVRQYIPLADGKRVFGYPTFYRTLTHAADAARRRCTERYGRSHHQQHRCHR